MQTGEPNTVAMVGFGVFIALSLLITYWAARRTHNTKDFYAAEAIKIFGFLSAQISARKR